MGPHQHSRKRQVLCRLLYLVLPDRIARRIIPSTPILIGSPSALRESLHLDTPNVLHVHRVSSCDKRRVTVNTLPDDVLLLIFLFDRVAHGDQDRIMSAGRLRHLGLAYSEGMTYLNGLNDADPMWRLSCWYRLVHVCRRWRSVVFASPHFLNLRLICGPRTRVELTGVWPPLPIIIRNVYNGLHMPEDYDFDAAIVHPNRVRKINLFYLTSPQLRRLALAMQEQFPALVHLMLDFQSYNSCRAPALPDGFLGGFAPGLRSLVLNSIPFPALPKLLLSATDLVRLSLWNIPHLGYISPEAIVTNLAVLVNLKSFSIGFESPLSRPGHESQRILPPARTVLPALTRFVFKGVCEYLEDLVARIDAPFLDYIWTTFFHQLIFNIPQLAQFTRRTMIFQALNEAHVDFDYGGVRVVSLPPTQTFHEKSVLKVSCRKLDWQLSSLTQVFTSFFPSFDMVEHLYIYGPPHRYSRPQWQDDIENVEWLEIFHPFTAVKNLYISKELVQRIAPALQEVIGERATDVLPALESLFLEELQPWRPVREALEPFIIARQLLDHPVAVFDWNR